MLRDFCKNICLNKNILMLVTVGIYILALFSAFSGLLLQVSFIITLVFILSLVRDFIKPKYILVWTFIFYFGVLNASFRMKDTDNLLNIAPVNSTIYGQVISIPQQKDGDKYGFFFKVKRIEYDSMTKDFEKGEKTYVSLNTPEKFKIYDYYEIQGRLSSPFKAGNPSQFDYGNYLRNFSAYSVFYGKEYKLSEGNLSACETLLQKINNYREKIIEIHAKTLKTPNLEILGGIVFGDDAISPPNDIKQSFINSGLLHILAASGMNVAFIFSFFFFFLSLFKINYKANIIFCMSMVLVYSLMTGLSPSVVRASSMLIFVLIGKLIDRDANSVALLSFVAFLMLLYNPMYLNNVGFQLSFIVTFGLLIMTPLLVRSKNRIVNWIIGTVSIPIIAQLWVIPVQIFYFNNISLYSVFANIMSVPVLSIISFGGFVSSLIAPVTSVCKLFDIILNPLISILIEISDFWGNLPHASSQTTHPSIFQILVYYGILLVITAFFNKEIREKYIKVLLTALISFILVLLISLIPVKNSNLEIMAFDVGNADAFLIKTTDNKYLMIDTAKSGYNGGKSQAEFLILRYLLDRGIKNVDAVIVTHFDNDHCGGAVDLMKGVKVKNLYVNSLNHHSKAAEDIYKTAKENDVNLILAENKQLVYDEGKVKVSNFVSDIGQKFGDNESSIITLLEYGDFKMLFMGDAGITAFENVRRDIPKDITVLKVGHHGASKVVNEEMVKYLNPKISLISVGENKFGHPAVYTLEVLKNTRILRTDVDNSIKITVNDKGYAVYAYSIPKKRYSKVLSSIIVLRTNKAQ